MTLNKVRDLAKKCGLGVRLEGEIGALIILKEENGQFVFRHSDHWNKTLISVPTTATPAKIARALCDYCERIHAQPTDYAKRLAATEKP